MVELTLQESIDIDGGVTWSTVVTGVGMTLIGVSCLIAAPTVTVAALGYAAYNVGSVVTILGACDL